MPIESKENNGLRVPLSTYRKLKAFQSGGYFWDHQPQQLVRQFLGDFLPPVELWEDAEGSFGWFRRNQGGKERLSKSVPVGGKRIPQEHLTKLAAAIDEFSKAAHSEDTQPHNRDIIAQFRLPNPEVDPELYRLHGPPWDRRLEVLWGCEKTPDSSLPPGAAVRILKPDRLYYLKQLLWLVLGALSLLLLLWLLLLLGSALAHLWKRATHEKPVAAMAITNVDLPKRDIQLNLGGTASDAKINGYNVDWGDGTKQFVPISESHPKKEYAKDGDYNVSAAAVDDTGAESNPVERPLKLDYEAKEKTAEDARIQAAKAAEDAKEKADAEQRAREFAAKKKAAEDKARDDAEAEAIKQAADQARLQAQKAADEKLRNEAAEKDAKAKEASAGNAGSTPQGAAQKSRPAPGSFTDLVTGRNVKPITFDKPKYPSRARADGISGMVQVEFTVDKQGLPKDARVTAEENGSYFRDAVLDALRRARFQPASTDGEPIEQRVSYQVIFHME